MTKSQTEGKKDVIYEKYYEMYDDTVRKFLLKMFKKSYTEGYFISDLLKISEGKWLFKFKKL